MALGHSRPSPGASHLGRGRTTPGAAEVTPGKQNPKELESQRAEERPGRCTRCRREVRERPCPHCRVQVSAESSARPWGRRGRRGRPVSSVSVKEDARPACAASLRLCAHAPPDPGARAPKGTALLDSLHHSSSRQRRSRFCKSRTTSIFTTGEHVKLVGSQSAVFQGAALAKHRLQEQHPFEGGSRVTLPVGALQVLCRPTAGGLLSALGHGTEFFPLTITVSP